MRLVTLLPLFVTVATALGPTRDHDDDDDDDDDKLLVRLVPVPLQTDDAQALLDCIVVIPDQHYFISVSGPWIVVAPLEHRPLDCAGPDAALCRCVHASAAKLMMQMASGQEPPIGSQGASAFEVEVDDLVGAGAMSLTTQAPYQVTEKTTTTTKPPPPLHYPDLSVRAPPPPPGSFCTIFPSDYEDCRSHDLKHAHYAQCYSHQAWYRSIQAGNSDPEKMVHFEIWPHHACRGGPHAVVVPPRTLSPCLQDRRVYSYRATLFDNGDATWQQKRPSGKLEAAKKAEEKARSREAARRRKEWKEAKAKSFGGGGRTWTATSSGWTPYRDRAVSLLSGLMRAYLDNVLSEQEVPIEQV